MTQETMMTLITSIGLPLLAAVAAFIIAFLRKKTQELTANIGNEIVKKNVDAAIEAALQAVDYTAQTYVDALKKAGSFSKEAQLEAFRRCKVVAVSMISESAQKVITDAYGDFETWINTKIEQLVRYDKALPEKAADAVVTTAAATAATIAMTAVTQVATEPAEKPQEPAQESETPAAE